MELDADGLERFLAWTGRPDRHEAWRRIVREGGPGVPEVGENGAIWLFPTGSHGWALSLPRGEGTEELVAPLLERARRHGLAQLSSRQRVGHPIVPVLLDQGFQVVNERVEYMADVADLPVETGCPWRWTATGPGSLIDAAGVGPEWEEGDDGAQILAGHASTATHRCEARFAWEGDEPVAFVLPRVEMASGWSTLSFLGLAPRLRGRGLGQHVHRHGFARLKALGAGTYHGGTSARNTAMRRLFETHGCRLHAELLELSIDL